MVTTAGSHSGELLLALLAAEAVEVVQRAASPARRAGPTRWSAPPGGDLVEIHEPGGGLEAAECDALVAALARPRAGPGRDRDLRQPAAGAPTDLHARLVDAARGLRRVRDPRQLDARGARGRARRGPGPGRPQPRRGGRASLGDRPGGRRPGRDRRGAQGSRRRRRLAQPRRRGQRVRRRRRRRPGDRPGARADRQRGRLRRRADRRLRRRPARAQGSALGDRPRRRRGDGQARAPAPRAGRARGGRGARARGRVRRSWRRRRPRAGERRTLRPASWPASSTPTRSWSGEAIEPEYGQVERLVDDGALTVGSSGAIVACGAARLGMRRRLRRGRRRRRRRALHARRARAPAGSTPSAAASIRDRATGLSVVLSTRGRPRDPDLGRGDVEPRRRRRRRRDAGAPPSTCTSRRPTCRAGCATALAELFARAHAAGRDDLARPRLGPGRAMGPTGSTTRSRRPTSSSRTRPRPARLAGVDEPEAALAALADADRRPWSSSSAPEGAIARRGAESARAEAPPVDGGRRHRRRRQPRRRLPLRPGQRDGRWPRRCASASPAASLSTRALGGVDAQPALAEALELARAGRSTEEVLR